MSHARDISLPHGATAHAIVREMRHAVSFAALGLLALLAADAAAATPITIVGTSDLHGRVERTPVLAGALTVLRKEVKDEGGGVVFVDAGDLFQGTLESNLVEGKSVIAAYNIIKPAAAAIGNHEFDYGPAGPLTIPRTAKDDPRGALKARIREAKFPFLAANLIDEKTGKPVAWRNTRPSTIVTVAGVKIGIIGVTTIETPHTTTAANLKGLEVTSLREAVAREADRLRKRGAVAVVLAAHAGGACKDVEHHDDTSSCDKEAEIFTLATSLPKGIVDVIVAAHTHQQIAQNVNGIPVIESWANGRGFGRVDLDVDQKARTVKVLAIHDPHALCVDDRAPVCVPADYDGHKVVPDKRVAAVVAPYVKAAEEARHKKLGVTVIREVKRGYDTESALGNLFADLMLDAAHDAGWPADVAIMNGGGIRANLPAGDLTYGQVFEMMPFDNRYARISVTGKILREWLESNLGVRKGGILSVAGVVADVSCEGKKAHVTLKHPDGKPLADGDHVDIVTTDFLATGGEATKLPQGAVTYDEGDPIREYVARALQKRFHSLDGDDGRLFDPAHRRLRPGRCKAM